MNYEMLDENLPIPKTKRERSAPKHWRAAIEQYKQAYREVYKTTPEVEIQGKWIKIQWQKDRVNLKRLKEMTKMLKARIEV